MFLDQHRALGCGPVARLGLAHSQRSDLPSYAAVVLILEGRCVAGTTIAEAPD
jgi:hypothetical protein